MPRQGWNRATPPAIPNLQEIETMIAPAFPRQKVQSFKVAAGGLANTNICVSLSDRNVLLRLFQREPGQALKEVRLIELVARTVPTARVHYYGETNDFTGQPYVLMEWIDAPRLETVIDRVSSPDQWIDITKGLGAALSAIHDFKFPRFGFLGSNLKVTEPLQFGSSDFLSFAKDCLITRNGSLQLGRRLSERALEFIAQEGRILDEFPQEPCLAHCDFGGSNILVKKENDRWKVAAVLDWEFAWSGTPYMDFGNLLRKPLGGLPEFAANVHSSYTACGGTLAPPWRRLSLMIDLGAWFEFATRIDASDELVSDARAVVSDTMDNWGTY